MSKYRSNTCGELRKADVGRQVRLSGWIHSVRDHGGVIFIDLRDHYGITQIVIDPECAFYQALERWRVETVVRFDGVVVARSESTVNPKLATGEIEVKATDMEILGEAEVIPFLIAKDDGAPEAMRLKYRFLDLRREQLHRNIMLRSKVIAEMRRYMTAQGFNEFQTPILTASSPEGARDYLVPSRLHPGKFYALPQAPQQFKQLLMVAGFDRYFQIAPCFRDEDARADRSPGEFYQMDVEMSFVEQDDIFEVIEGLIADIFEKFSEKEFSRPPFVRIPYREAMRRFGSDKPDTRFGMEFVELMDVLKGTGEFSVFNDASYIGGICAPGCASYTRKQLDQLTDFVKRSQIGAKGLVYARVQEDGSVKSSVDKFYTQEVLLRLKETMKAVPGDLILIMSGEDVMKTRKQLCELRLEMGTRLGLRDKNKFSLLWVVDFPMFEWSEEEGRLMAMHHPFTHPKDEDIPLLDSNPAAVRADAYDMVCNGVEVGGGSIRIHDPELQDKMFKILGFTEERAQEQFGFLMNAFKYGAPPHGGIGIGLDRLAMIMTGNDSLRDVTAFPKVQNASELMSGAPNVVDEEQLQELSISIIPEKKEN